jgi:hypothetical protein
MDSLRKTKIKYIKDNIVDVDDDDVTTLYEKVILVVPRKLKNDNQERIEKVKYIENNLRYIDDPNLDYLRDRIEKSLIYEETDEDRKKRVVLEIINRISVAIGKKQIKDLCDFVNIRRNMMLSDDVKTIVNDNREYIFKNGFNKSECMVYQKNLRNPHYSIIKGMLKQIGYDIVSKNTSKYVNKVREMFTVYSIIKSEQE